MKDLLVYNKNFFFKACQPYILVFKTNIRFKKDIKAIAAVLNKQSSILNWNIDRADVDKILRIESTKNNSSELISTVLQAGYHCEELPG